MFEKVSTKEIKKIKERLEAELEDKSLPLRRKAEVESLIMHLSFWLEWRDYRDRTHYREVIQSHKIDSGYSERVIK
ncbi:hypothetical protein ES705_15738 [subsurface metagenome]|nr:hypothetical protein [Clostridia bacterium]